MELPAKAATNVLLQAQQAAYLSPSLSRAQPHLPLTVCEEEENGILSPAAPKTLRVHNFDCGSLDDYI